MIRSNDIENTKYQKVITDVTVDIPAAKEMIVSSTVKGNEAVKQDILTSDKKKS